MYKKNVLLHSNFSKINMSFKRKFSNGKNSKFLYYLPNAIACLMPNWIYRLRLKNTLQKTQKHADYNYILSRVNYYNKLQEKTILAETNPTIGNLQLKGNKSVYFFDSFKYIRWFDPNLKWNYIFGDITFIPSIPSIVKSRPINGDNANSVILNLNKVRHFNFINDSIPFTKKKKLVIFRGEVEGKANRMKFMEMFHHYPKFDFGCVDICDDVPIEWYKNKLSIREHLDYKFIMALEGNDVASNLKWVMSSNSIAVMPRPKYETWFMEGTLVPNHHYIEIKSDFSDLEEKLDYYEKNPHRAEEIIKNAHKFVEQFFNQKQEQLISLLVLEKYFQMTN
jgi:hypothetical protein